MRNILTHIPCSIAEVLSLIAGSKICGGGMLSEGVEWISENELMRAASGREVETISWLVEQW